MSAIENKALELGRREKRLKYWKHEFNRRSYNQAQVADVNELLRTYALLISRLINPTSEAEHKDAEGRLYAVERVLTTLFEDSRLKTSPLGLRPSSEH